MATNEKIIWDYLKNQGLSDAGAAGLMGNLYAESGLNPMNLQNSYEKKLGYTDKTYTEAVDNGTYTNFAHDEAGYGLSQLTYYTRKQKFENYAKKKNKSIGDLQTQLEFLFIELETNFTSLLKLLKTTNVIQTASTAVLVQFERPADQSAAIQAKRLQYSLQFYNKYSGGDKQMKYNDKNKPIVCMQKNSTCYKQTRTMKVYGILIHSTGANNPTVKRYVQPHETDSNYQEMIDLLGYNKNKNDYNHKAANSGLNAFIGKLGDYETVAAVQTMPWDYRPWGCGSGAKGSCNNGWIQFEICEDNLQDETYFAKVYEECIQLVAYLCKMYNLNPLGSVKVNNTNVPVILCHADSCKLGFGSNHGDILHWFPKYGKTMADIRNDVYELLQADKVVPDPEIPEEEEEEMTQEKFNEMMNVWIAESAKKEPSSWSAVERTWAEKEGFIQGDTEGRKMYKKFLTREEMVVLLYRFFQKYLNK